MLAARIALSHSRGRVRAAAPLDGKRPTVSVVIPCYKYGHFLPEGVRAATDMRDVDVEVIIVDDASPDDSAEVAARLAEADSRIRLIRHETNKGHIQTYNDGLAAATGEYVTLVSADDLLTPDSLSRAVALMEGEPSVGFVYGRAVRFSEQPPPARKPARTIAWATWRGDDWIAERCRTGYNVIASPEVVMRTSLIREIGGYRADLPHAGDYEMWLRAASSADVGFIVGADQALYRVHEINMHKTMFDSGQHNGLLVDLQQRAASFAAVLDSEVDRDVDSAAGPAGPVDAGDPVRAERTRELSRRAKRTLAAQALDEANYAYARGFTDFPLAEFEALAYSLDPDVATTSAGRAFLRRKARGMSRLPIHPLWFWRAVYLRLRVEWLRRRRLWVGV